MWDQHESDCELNSEINKQPWRLGFLQPVIFWDAAWGTLSLVKSCCRYNVLFTHPTFFFATSFCCTERCIHTRTWSLHNWGEGWSPPALLSLPAQFSAASPSAQVPTLPCTLLVATQALRCLPFASLCLLPSSPQAISSARASVPKLCAVLHPSVPPRCHLWVHTNFPICLHAWVPKQVRSVAQLQQEHGPFTAVVVAAGAAVGSLTDAPLQNLPVQLCQVGFSVLYPHRWFNNVDCYKHRASHSLKVFVFTFFLAGKIGICECQKCVHTFQPTLCKPSYAQCFNLRTVYLSPKPF